MDSSRNCGPSLGSQIPDFAQPEEPDPIFDLDYSPESVEPESKEEVVTPSLLSPPRIPIQIGSRWEPDEPFDSYRAASISDSEKTILETASGREVSPSDAELQAVLEVGRTRLSQIFNGLRRAGLLSVRKQGRTRLFKLSDTATAELGMN